MKKSILDEFGEQFSNDDDRYLETLSYWLEHVSSVTWKTLLDILGHFETWHTVDELTDKIVSVLGGGHQVSVQVMCVKQRFSVVCWQVVLSCHVCMCLSCFLLLSGGNCDWPLQTCHVLCPKCGWRNSHCREESTLL